jgi:hypothetical protein
MESRTQGLLYFPPLRPVLGQAIPVRSTGRTTYSVQASAMQQGSAALAGHGRAGQRRSIGSDKTNPSFVSLSPCDVALFVFAVPSCFCPVGSPAFCVGIETRSSKPGRAGLPKEACGVHVPDPERNQQALLTELSREEGDVERGELPTCSVCLRAVSAGPSRSPSYCPGPSSLFFSAWPALALPPSPTATETASCCWISGAYLCIASLDTGRRSITGACARGYWYGRAWSAAWHTRRRLLSLPPVAAWHSCILHTSKPFQTWF